MTYFYVYRVFNFTYNDSHSAPATGPYPGCCACIVSAQQMSHCC